MGMRVVSSYVNPVTNEPVPYIYFSVNNAGNTVTAVQPFDYDAEIQDNPVVRSPDKTTARRWRYTQTGFVNQVMPVEYATCEYVIMTAPNGTQYAYTIDNSGTWGMALWTADASRALVTTLMHKQDLVWVADNRQPTPRKGDV